MYVCMYVHVYIQCESVDMLIACVVYQHVCTRPMFMYNVLYNNCILLHCTYNIFVVESFSQCLAKRTTLSLFHKMETPAAVQSYSTSPGVPAGTFSEA